VKTFYYGHALDLENLRSATRRCCETYGAACGRVVWFDTAEATGVNHTRVLLKEFGHDGQADDVTGGPAIVELDDCEPETGATFSAFALAMADHGFDFLQQRRMTGHHGPVLVSRDNGVIVGAIGPLTIMPDRAGAHVLLPQYFGVLPAYRGGGHGRALWRAVQRWGVLHRADYQLLQARVGAASEYLFLSEGLRSLGFTAMVAA
jgi:hypothetical protein